MPSQDLIIPILPRPGSNKSIDMSKPGIDKVNSMEAAEVAEHNTIKQNEDHLVKNALRRQVAEERYRNKSKGKGKDEGKHAHPPQEAAEASPEAVEPEEHPASDKDDPHVIDTYV